MGWLCSRGVEPDAGGTRDRLDSDLVLAVVLLAPTPAHSGTIVFDFEDGLQGWELSGAVQRVQTQLLGGEWAIFGDGLVDRFLFGPAASISIQADLTAIGSISFEQFIGDGALGRTPFLSVFVDGIALVSDPVGDANPSLRIFAMEPLEGLHDIKIRWGGFLPNPRPLLDRFLAFIDNITFHTIPEPSVLGMLVLGGVAVLARQRSRC